MSSIAVRIPRAAHAKLQHIAEEQDTTVGSVIADWVAEHEEQQFWAQLRDQIARTKADPEAWAEVEAEQRLFDGALMDGLEEE